MSIVLGFLKALLIVTIRESITGGFPRLVTFCGYLETTLSNVCSG